jgi:long-chain acyl-CoA synthetase
VGYLAPVAHGRRKRIVAVSPGLEVRLVDSVGQPVAPGEMGEIVLRGRGLMKGYWGRPVTEHETLTREGFATGDMGRLDGRGHIELLGRRDEMLKVGGRKVSPMEVEAALDQHSAVAESAVIGRADPQAIFENQLHAFVVLRDASQPVTTADLLDHCRLYLEPYKLPARIHVLASLPKSPVGKVLRRALASADAPNGPPNSTEQRRPSL